VSAHGSGIDWPPIAHATKTWSRFRAACLRPMSQRRALCAFWVTSKATPAACWASLKRPRKVNPLVSFDEMSLALSAPWRSLDGCWFARTLRSPLSEQPVTMQTPLVVRWLASYCCQAS